MNTWLVVLAGGSGTRFWPLSRQSNPKQLLKVVNNDSLLSLTVRRFNGWIPPERVLIVTTEMLAPSVAKDLASFKGVNILAEPEARNTAPCIVMAMEWLRSRDPEAVAVVVPADHWITEEEEYREVMKRAVAYATTAKVLCTIGIQPTRPETGFGYIRGGASVSDGVLTVERFVEKPSKEVAETMVQSPEYLWNAGMFVWDLETFFSELEKNAGDQMAAFSNYRSALRSNPKEAKEVLHRDYKKAPAISIDYALLEKTKKVVVVPGSSFAWNDLGSFVALEEVYPKCEGGVARAAQVLSIDSLANVIDCPGKTVALLGVTDMIIVDAGDVLLVAAKERAQDVKKFVERLKKSEQNNLI